jgi:phage terminase small subunit
MKAETYKKKIVSDMKTIGTYKPEFNRVIDNLAKICEDMDTARSQFEKSGGSIVVKHTNKNGSTNLAKNPFFLAIEGLQQNILQYSRELGLTPSGLKKITGENVQNNDKEESPFAKFMKQRSG